MPPVFRILTTLFLRVPFAVGNVLFRRALAYFGLAQRETHWTISQEIFHAAARTMAQHAIFTSGALRSDWNTGKVRVELREKSPRGLPDGLEREVWRVERAASGDPIAVEATWRKEIDLNDKAKTRVIVMWHGGGFAVGDPTAVWHHNVRLALATNSLCLAAAYALPPAEPFPAALNDADTIYSHLLSLGYLPENITLAGYSAGANLALSLAFRLLSQSRPLPARLALWAPWVDMTNSAPSTRLNNLCMLPTTGDGTISISLGQENTYSTFVESKTPAVSPLFYPSSAYSQLASHISIWMGIGDLDRLRDEGLLLVLRCLAADIPTRAILADESTHMLADEPETTTGRVAYDSLIAFLTTPAATSISRISYTGAPSPLSADSIRAILRASLDAYAKTVKRGKPAIRERWTDLGFRAVWDELVPWCWA